MKVVEPEAVTVFPFMSFSLMLIVNRFVGPREYETVPTLLNTWKVPVFVKAPEPVEYQIVPKVEPAARYMCPCNVRTPTVGASCCIVPEMSALNVLLTFTRSGMPLWSVFALDGVTTMLP
jgi:hypothetical protein